MLDSAAQHLRRLMLTAASGSLLLAQPALQQGAVFDAAFDSVEEMLASF